MAKVQKTVITALGEQMLFSSALTYTDATLCSQDVSNLTTDQLRALTDLTGKVLSSPISAHKRQGNTKADQVDVQVTFTNRDQKTDINYSSIGWFARDRQGHETLIAVTPFIGTDTIAAAPPDGTATSSKNITLSMAVGTATEINVLIDPAGSVTPSTFNAEVDKINEALALKADNAELADYAKKADVNSALDAKADKTALDPLAKSEDVAKDVETLNSAINLKADKTDLAPLAKTEDVNTELDKKADKTALDDYAKSSDVAADVKQLTDSIATKADAKTVDDAIDKIDFTPYAKTADVQAELDTKANTTDLAPFAKSTDVDKQIENVNNAVTNATNTEQANIDKINKALATKRDITDSYSKDELDKKFLQLSTDTGGKVDANQVATMIENKADKSDVTKQIGTVTDLVNTKANSTDVDAALDKKDDITDVDAKIKTVIDLANTKADKTDVTAQFATKADKTTVEQELAVKANSADVYTKKQVDDALSSRDTAIATKADKATVDAEISKIDFTPYAKTADVNKQIKTVNAQIADAKNTAQSNLDKVKSDLNGAINTKANSDDVYNKSNIDSAFNTRDNNINRAQSTADGALAGYNKRPVISGGASDDLLSFRTTQLRYYPGNGNTCKNLPPATNQRWFTVEYIFENPNGDGIAIYRSPANEIWTIGNNDGYYDPAWVKVANANDIQGLQNQINTKANTGDVSALQNKVNVNTPLFREISADSTWEDIFGVTNPNNVLTSLRINPGGNGQLVNDHAAGIGFGGNDTKAVISVDYGSHVARFTAGNGTAPDWSEDVAWKSDISSLTQALTKLQAAFDAQQTKIAALQATVNNQANQLTYFKQHYIEGKAFDADQIKQAMAWTGDDGQKLAIIRDKENEGGK